MSSVKFWRRFRKIFRDVSASSFGILFLVFFFVMFVFVSVFFFFNCKILFFLLFLLRFRFVRLYVSSNVLVSAAFFSCFVSAVRRLIMDVCKRWFFILSVVLDLFKFMIILFCIFFVFVVLCVLILFFIFCLLWLLFVCWFFCVLVGVKLFVVSKRKKNMKNMMYLCCVFVVCGFVIIVIVMECE